MLRKVCGSLLSTILVALLGVSVTAPIVGSSLGQQHGTDQGTAGAALPPAADRTMSMPSPPEPAMSMPPPPPPPRAHATKKAAVKTGHTTEKAADKPGDATKTAAKGTQKGVKRGTKAVGHGVKKGAEKTVDPAK